MQIELNPKQGLAFNSVATELLFGGAAGPGKSYELRVSGIRWCMEVPGIQVYLFRRTLRDLRDNHLRGPNNLFSMLADHTKSGQVKYRAVENEFEFWNDSRLHLCYCDSENDVENYRGAEIHVLLPDELTHFSDFQYRFLRGRVRKAGLNIPAQYAGDLDYVARKTEAIRKNDKALMAAVKQFERDHLEALNFSRDAPNPFPKLPRIEAASNPGSIGHAWVKRTWIAPHKPMTLWQAEPMEGGMIREYIPGKLADNPHLMKDDPDYADRLRGSGSEDLVRAILDGDWDIVAGQAFEKLRRDTHCIPAFPENEPPRDWLVFGSFDWGSSKPFSFGLWAVSNGDALPDHFGANAGRVIRRGAVVRFNELYGWNGKPNEGRRLEVSEVAKAIKQMCGNRKIAYIAADPSCWKVDGGPSHAELMMREGVILRRADNSRHAGYQALRSRIAGDEDGPMLYATENCHAGFWRTMPDIVMDDKDFEDIDTDQEDHCADDCRYAVMSRPWMREVDKPKERVERWLRFDDDDEDSWRTA